MPVWVAALWWASLTSLGFWVVPLLFLHLPTPAMAGGMAARLFTAQTWVSIVCGLFLLLNTRSNRPLAQVPISQTAIIFIVSGMLLAVLSDRFIGHGHGIPSAGPTERGAPLGERFLYGSLIGGSHVRR